MSTLLLITLALPLVGMFFTSQPDRARWVSLLVTVLTAVLAGWLCFSYPGGTDGFAVTDVAWLGGSGGPINVRFSVGLDGLSVWLYGLTALLMVVSVLISWEAIRDLPARYFRLLLLLETGLLGVFTARDIILFYVFFEFTLIPLYVLIGIWGSEERHRAATKFFLYTLAGSLLTFLGLLAVVLWDYWRSGQSLTFSIPELTARLAAQPLEPRVQLWIFLALFAGFAVKVPLFPLHTWLPLAHVQAPAAGSVVLAGLLLKIGTYGFFRFSLPLLPAATATCLPWILWLAVIGIIYGALVALAQSDIKKLIAYSSVSHLGYCMLGIFALNSLAAQGGALQMINHGVSTGALFALVGMLYERYHTRKVADFGGLARRLPVFSFFLVFFSLSSIGLPGLNNFAGEILVLVGAFQRAWIDPPAGWDVQGLVVVALAVAGVILGAWYMLQLVQRVCFGPVREPHAGGEHPPVSDLTGREIAALVPLAVFAVWIGVAPRCFVKPMEPTLEKLIAPARAALESPGEPQAQGAKPAGGPQRSVDRPTPRQSGAEA